MGALVSVEPLDESTVLDVPWVVTFGPLDEEDDWEPVVCGPYERPHALALAEAVVADDDLMAVVEPLLPRVSVDEIRDEISEAQRGAAEEWADSEAPANEAAPPATDEAARPPGRIASVSEPGPSTPPSPDEIRAGFHRIAARLTAAQT